MHVLLALAITLFVVGFCGVWWDNEVSDLTGRYQLVPYASLTFGVVLFIAWCLGWVWLWAL